MQQNTVKNTRSISRPLIWITLALHLGLGAYLYVKTTAPTTGVETEMAAHP
jgi:hypothetical protein